MQAGRNLWRHGMTLEQCRKCTHHYSSQRDDILCRFNGGFDYLVSALDRKGIRRVVMCPLEMPLLKSDEIAANNLRSQINPM